MSRSRRANESQRLTSFYWGNIEDKEIEKVYLEEIYHKIKLIPEKRRTATLLYGTQFGPKKGFYHLDLLTGETWRPDKPPPDDWQPNKLPSDN